MFVYLIGSWNCAKIGRSGNPEARLLALDSTLMPFEPVLITKFYAGPAASFVEKKLHEHFADRHIRGEWFDCVTKKAFLRYAKKFALQYIPKKSKPAPKIDPVVLWHETNAENARMNALLDGLIAQEAQ